MPYQQNFENTNDLTIVNGTQVNKWNYGSAVGNTGKSLYISDNDGVSNTYTITSLSSVHAYKDLVIPAGTTIAKFSFDWKANGQTTVDYLRVWLVPTTFTPTAGTLISAGSGKLLVGGYFNLVSTWQTYDVSNLDVSSFAGQTMRLVFEWRNNATLGTQNPAAIDNISLSIPTCLVPSAPSPTIVGGTTATLGWIAPSVIPGNGYEYYVSATNTPPTATTNGMPATGISATATGLAPSTTYYWWVRSICSATDKSDWIQGSDFVTTQIPATLPYSQNFNINNDFAFENGSQVNKWYHGAAAGNTGNSIYISGDNGATNTYLLTTTSTTQAYRDIAIPANANIAAFSFDWRANGQTTLDYLRVWLVPSDYLPTAGTQITVANSGGTQVETYFNLETNWQTYSVPNLDVSSFAGKTMRLVFEWRNNATLGTQNPAAIDNINLSIPSCFVPDNLSATSIGATTAQLEWVAPTPVPALGYEYYVSSNNTAPTAATAGVAVTGLSTTATGLNPTTTYYWWVRSICSATEKSDWIQGSDFITTQVPATLPYHQNFNSSNDFAFENGTQVNKWFYGNAAGNGGNSIFISNDNGLTNTYTLTTLSTTQAYRDIAIPAGTTTTNFSFDWKANGQTTLDYCRVWLVPSTYQPTAGTQITVANSGGKQVGTYFNLQSTWQTYDTPNLDVSNFAGQTMRLVFEWRNNAATGTQNPIAIDNIVLEIPSCLVPSATTASNVAATTLTLGWDAPTPAPATGYEYYISTVNTMPAANAVGTIVPTTIANPTGLNPSTTYYWWVRSVCTTINKSDWIAGPSFITTQIPATLPYQQDFSLDNDFKFENGTQLNQWYFGNAAGNTGKSIYISNDNGVSNTYTLTTISTTQAYRDIAIPAGSTTATFSFDWRAEGQTTLDYCRVWLVPTTYNPVAGTQITAAASGGIQLGTYFNQQDSWTNYLNTNVNVSSFAGKTMRLVFEWRNNATLGTQNPIAIDNINFYIPSCFAPTTLSTSNIGVNNATLGWSAVTPTPAMGYEYYMSTNSTPPTSATTGTMVTTNGATPTSLVDNTVYYWWVRSVCTTSDRGLWIAGPSFNTLQNPATIPYIQNFSVKNDFTLENGAQVNKWYYGNVVGNTGYSLYISDDNGLTNNYDITTLSTTHAFRDIIIPVNATVATLAFDWRAAGQTTLDYLRVWLVPITYKPTAGTLMSTGSGRIQVGSYFNQLDTWQSYENTNVNISSFAGTTMRLVFEWRNNAATGTQTPAAIDNIKVLICSNATPTITIANVLHNTVDLSWNQDIGGASYIIRYRPIGTAIWNSVAVNAVAYPATTNTYTLTNLIPATQYEVEVAGVCNNAEGTYSHNTFITRCDPTPPNISLTNITNSSALITWSPLATNATYLLRWREVGATVWNEVFNLVPPLNTYQLNNLGSYKTYEVQLANICIGDTTQNNWSTPQVFTTERDCVIPPPGLTITNLTISSAEIIWDGYPGATYIVKYRKVGSPSWISIPVNANTYTFTQLLELTQYEMQVANVCNGVVGDFTKLYLFTTPAISYCQVASADASTEYISKVTANPTGKPQMINTSLGSNYSDFTTDLSKVVELVQGTANNQIIIDKKMGTNTNAGVAVWIDFNRNGYFDIDERVLADGPNGNPTATATFSVPVDASVSIADNRYVVMRVALQKDGIPVTCESFQAGEVEDYIVKISKQGVPNALNQNDIIIYPNPVSTILFVKNISKKAQYKIYNVAGQIVSNGILLNNQISVANLSSGVYVIDIEDTKGNVQKKFIKE
ncbi:MAG: fibronectin type III domain-containing protein [Chryseobacterium sp.]|nr:fibronectin type III domain-containing protein [Candidatus Chryseobacterium enterohippi]